MKEMEDMEEAKAASEYLLQKVEGGGGGGGGGSHQFVGGVLIAKGRLIERD